MDDAVAQDLRKGLKTVAAFASIYLPAALILGTIAWVAFLGTFGVISLIGDVPTLKLLIGTGASLVPTLILFVVLLAGQRLDTTVDHLRIATRIIATLATLAAVATLIVRVYKPMSSVGAFILLTYVLLLVLMVMLIELMLHDTKRDVPVRTRLLSLAMVLMTQALLFGWYRGVDAMSDAFGKQTLVKVRSMEKPQRLLFIGSERVYCISLEGANKYTVTPVAWADVERLDGR